jgi:hypothetical protein
MGCHKADSFVSGYETVEGYSGQVNIQLLFIKFRGCVKKMGVSAATSRLAEIEQTNVNNTGGS